MKRTKFYEKPRKCSTCSEEAYGSIDGIDMCYMTFCEMLIERLKKGDKLI